MSCIFAASCGTVERLLDVSCGIFRLGLRDNMWTKIAERNVDDIADPQCWFFNFADPQFADPQCWCFNIAGLQLPVNIADSNFQQHCGPAMSDQHCRYAM